jgi:mannan endo-1,4-beta-mannosidase
MKYRLVTLISFFVAVTAIAFTTHHLSFNYKTPVVHAKLSPKLLSYLGVYEAGSPPAYRPVAEFAAMANRRPNLVGYYSGWAEPFNTSFADMVHRHGVIPYVQIDPTLAKFSAIASGAYDGYLRSYADSVRDYGHAVVIGFGHEMNAPWYSWGYRNVPAKTFVAAWRHIVTLFNGEGARNVTWLWTINQDLPGTGRIAAWWPGPKYVTWVGIDGYYFRSADTFDSVFGTTIRQVRRITKKPILLSETAVGPKTNRFAKIGDLFTGMQKNGMLGLVWFDIAQSGSIRHQDWRLEGKQPADAAFQLWVARTLTRS